MDAAAPHELAPADMGAFGSKSLKASILHLKNVCTIKNVRAIFKRGLYHPESVFDIKNMVTCFTKLFLVFS